MPWCHSGVGVGETIFFKGGETKQEMGNKTEFKTRNGKQDGIPQERGVNGKRDKTRNKKTRGKKTQKDRGKKPPKKYKKYRNKISTRYPNMLKTKTRFRRDFGKYVTIRRFESKNEVSVQAY